MRPVLMAVPSFIRAHPPQYVLGRSRPGNPVLDEIEIIAIVTHLNK